MDVYIYVCVYLHIYAFIYAYICRYIFLYIYAGDLSRACNQIHTGHFSSSSFFFLYLRFYIASSFSQWTLLNRECVSITREYLKGNYNRKKKQMRVPRFTISAICHPAIVRLITFFLNSFSFPKSQVWSCPGMLGWSFHILTSEFHLGAV